ncbi:hypothetical protein ACOBR2_16645 [Telmatobacter bradus]|uniref:hypothetical protein n=1 Tax=Telmatobacter bradus TaxID=474953 RepID=UPI003B43095F
MDLVRVCKAAEQDQLRAQHRLSKFPLRIENGQERTGRGIAQIMAVIIAVGLGNISGKDRKCNWAFAGTDPDKTARLGWGTPDHGKPASRALERATHHLEYDGRVSLTRGNNVRRNGPYRSSAHATS